MTAVFSRDSGYRARALGSSKRALVRTRGFIFDANSLKPDVRNTHRRLTYVSRSLRFVAALYSGYMIRVLCLLLLFAPALMADALPVFEIARAIPAPPPAPAPSKPKRDGKPWGLWANRAPYPYYDGFFGMDTDDDVVARDLQIDCQTGLWLAPGETRGGYFSARAHIGLFFLDFKFEQAVRTGHSSSFIGTNKIKDFSHIIYPAGHIGVAWPIPKLGYIEGGIGVGAFDETNGISSVGISYRAAALLYPIFPIGLEAWAERLQFFNGSGVNEFGLRLHVQVFRHLFLTAGWQWLNVDGSGYGSHGITFGLSFTFGNLRTFFWSPMKGPAY